MDTLKDSSDSFLSDEVVLLFNSMDCPNCEQINNTSAKFCEECGTPLSRKCAGCDHELSSTAKFCEECGTPAAETNSVTERSPAAYTPKHLADKILQSKSALEGELKQVTVMFADVKGSMELAAQLGPEDWHKILDRFFEILGESVHRFEGTINQYTGDGIMALFGAPIAHEDHAQRACFAALHVRDEIVKYSIEVKREHGVGFSTRMGLNSGDVVVGAIGDDLRMDYTAQGHTVGLAQRMESLAEPNTCYMTASTAVLAGGYFDLEDLGEFKVKGATGPIRIHHLKGIGNSVTRFDLSRAKGLSRFVGRASDIRTLEDALEQTDAGNGQVVGVVAEAGTGKSRLCFEFLERCRSRGMKVFEGRAVAHGRNIPFLPILEVFRAYFGITRQDDDQAAREKIAGRMVLLDKAFADTLPLLFDFLGVSDPQHPAPELDADSRQRQLIAVMRQLIHTVNEDQPTITMIEDLHWLDAASEEFLEHMVDARSGSRNMLLLNFRPEYSAEWMQKSWYRQIPLTPLGVEAIGELLANLLGTHPSLKGLASSVHIRTAGNPFFTEEVAQTLIESDHLEGTTGAYKLVTPVDKLEVPATVQAVLAARIDRLSEREKQLLQTASVIGKDFPEYLLTSISALSPDELKASLAELRRSEFILEQSIYPINEYAFKHPLTQEVALGSLLKDSRKQIHTAVARAIEDYDSEHLEECAALLAHHYDEAGENEHAATWHARAARWIGQNDIAAGAGHWNRVRQLLKDQPGSEDTARLGLTACIQWLRWSWRFANSPQKNQQAFEEGEKYASVVNDPREELHLSMSFTRTLSTAGQVDQYLERSLRDYEIARKMNDPILLSNAQAFCTDSYHWAGNVTASMQMAEQGLAELPRHTPREEWGLGVSPYCVFSFWRGVNLGWLGKFDEAFAEFARCRKMSEEDRTPEMLGYIASWESQVSYYSLNVERAEKNSVDTESICEAVGNPSSLLLLTQAAISYAHLSAGRPKEAAEHARCALKIGDTAERPHAGMCMLILADALLQANDLTQAIDAANDAITLCHELPRANLEAHAHGILACAMLRHKGIDAENQVETSLEEASSLIDRTGAKVLSPFLLEWRAELAQVRGNSEEHDRHMIAAYDLFVSMGATGHIKRLAGETKT